MPKNITRSAPSFFKTDIGELLTYWAEINKPNLARSTFENYVSKARIIDRYFKQVKLQNVDYRKLRAYISYQQKSYSNKTINETFIVLRAIFDLARKDELIGRNPMRDIENLKVCRSEPNPFTGQELLKIMNACNQDNQLELSMFRFGCLTGMRISELLALDWSNVDFDKKTVYVTRAVVQGRFKRPKTKGSIRKVELVDDAVELLKTVQTLTESASLRTYKVMQDDNKTVKPEKLRIVFLNSNTGKAICNENHYAKYFFRPILDKAGVRYRGPSHSRHTFASQMLVAGLPQKWIANQLGHSTTRMLQEHYGRWISEDAPIYTDRAQKHFTEIFGSGSNDKLFSDVFSFEEAA